MAIQGGIKDLVSLGSVNISSSTADVTFDGIFTDEFAAYKVYIDNAIPVTAGVRPRIFWRKSGSDTLGSAVHYRARSLYGVGDTVADLYNPTNTTGFNSFDFNMGNDADDIQFWDITMYPKAAQQANIFAEIAFKDAADGRYFGHYVSFVATGDATIPGDVIDGFRFVYATGAIATMRMQVYWKRI